MVSRSPVIIEPSPSARVVRTVWVKIPTVSLAMVTVAPIDSHPYPTLESLQYLLDQGVRTIVLDFLSLDMTPENPADAKLENHYLWSKANGIIGENFTNLGKLTGATPFISLLPLNMGASDGGPVRAVALSSLSSR